MPHTLVIVPVPEVEPYVSKLRERFDPAARRGLGAHVTLLHAALPAGGIDPSMSASVAAIASAVTPYTFTVTRVARFATTLYLAVEPAEPFEQFLLPAANGAVAAFDAGLRWITLASACSSVQKDASSMSR